VKSQGPVLPGPDDWRRWRIDVVRELHEGHQSRVFEARRDDSKLAVKLADARMADLPVLEMRSEAVALLGGRHGDVVAPLRIDGSLVQPVGDWLMTATEFVEGHRVSAADPADAELLGAALARLHGALAGLPPFDLPPIAALDRPGRSSDRADWQLLHGDFSTKNVIATSDGLRIFDFDDCGYGPTEYDVANSLYMELFDSTVTDRPERYAAFRPAFVAGYNGTSARAVADGDLDDMIDIRIDALGRWLDDLSSAPIGVRTASPAWHRTLADFVQSHR
jgi:Ser/Thr protein kinase RdoA (MazF antagonist)